MLQGSQAMLLAWHDTAMQAGMLPRPRLQKQEKERGVLDAEIKRKELRFTA
jgi:hypothetical protein